MFSSLSSHQGARGLGPMLLARSPAAMAAALIVGAFLVTSSRGVLSTLEPTDLLKIDSSVKLLDGNEMPRLGLGVYQISPRDTARSVGMALKAGVRMIDTAQMYGNEEGVGEAIRASGIARSELWVTTKVWVARGGIGMLDRRYVRGKAVGYNHTLAAVRESLRRLGLQQVDMVLLHSPYGGPRSRREAWRGLQEARRLGLTRSIGVAPS